MHTLPSLFLHVEDIKTLLHQLGTTDMHFNHPVQVVINPTFVLMELWGVSIDSNERLWVRSNRRDEIEVNSSLLYGQYILHALQGYLQEGIKQQLTK